MSNGTVKWFNTKKGYGFIIPESQEDDDKDIFVHVSKLHQTGLKKLTDGQKVSYEVYDDNGKPAAEQVTVIN